MPVQIRCECGKILDECSFEVFERKELYLNLIREKYNKKCPNCGRLLAQRPLNIDVKILDNAKKRNKFS
jgi:hypothetical protein